MNRQLPLSSIFKACKMFHKCSCWSRLTLLQCLKRPLQPEGVTKTICWSKHTSFEPCTMASPGALQGPLSLCSWLWGLAGPQTHAGCPETLHTHMSNFKHKYHHPTSLCPRSQSLMTCRLGSLCWHLKRLGSRVFGDGVWDVVSLGGCFVLGWKAWRT